jgi:hypothetical protein
MTCVTIGESQKLIPLSQLRAEYGLSDSTWRRALKSPVDPLPCMRVGLGDPKHARILIRRCDLEAWLARRNAAVASSPKSLVEEIVGRVLRDDPQ